MAQVKIFGLRNSLAGTRERWSDLIQQALVETLGLPKEKRFQRFIPLDPEDFVFPADRTPAYTIIEISMFAGRAPEALKALLGKLMADARAALGLHPNDLEITITETPRHCWGIRGLTGDELGLAYKVNV